MTNRNETDDRNEDLNEQEEQAETGPRPATSRDYFGWANEWLSISQTHTTQATNLMQAEPSLNLLDRRIMLAQVSALAALTHATLASILSERDMTAMMREANAQNAALIAQNKDDQQAKG